MVAEIIFLWLFCINGYKKIKFYLSCKNEAGWPAYGVAIQHASFSLCDIKKDNCIKGTASEVGG
jgi:hypothetical protein